MPTAAVSAAANGLDRAAISSISASALAAAVGRPWRGPSLPACSVATASLVPPTSTPIELPAHRPAASQRPSRITRCTSPASSSRTMSAGAPGREGRRRARAPPRAPRSRPRSPLPARPPSSTPSCERGVEGQRAAGKAALCGPHDAGDRCSRSRRPPSGSGPAALPAAGVASLTRTTRGPAARRTSSSTSGSTCTPSAITPTSARASASATPTRPGARWWSGAIALNTWVTSRAPGVEGAPGDLRRCARVAQRDGDAARAKRRDQVERPGQLGRERDEPDRGRRRSSRHAVRGRAQAIRRVHAGVGAVEERALEVDSRDRRGRVGGALGELRERPVRRSRRPS